MPLSEQLDRTGSQLHAATGRPVGLGQYRDHRVLGEDRVECFSRELGGSCEYYLHAFFLFTVFHVDVS